MTVHCIEGDQVCRCGFAKRQHVLANFADGPMVGAGVLICPGSVFSEREFELRDEIDTLCQAIEGHRAGALTNDGLWHYHEKARALLQALDTK